MVLLIRYFRDAFPHLQVPLHLTGSDSCEIFFSKVGGMQGMERAYDFQELVGCANTVNQLVAIEYAENGLRFDRAHNKQRNIWADLHPLEAGEAPANLANFSSLSTNEDIIVALREGLKEAQSLLTTLNMAPSTVAKCKMWFLQPWKVESADPKHWAYVPPPKPVPGEDGDVEVLRETLNVGTEVEDGDCDHEAIEDEVTGANDSMEDGQNDLRVVEDECRDAIS